MDMSKLQAKSQYMLWRKLQELEWSMYKESPIGVFSVEGLAGAEATGTIIQETIKGGSCLDIGCGALRKPSYMGAAPDVLFSGVDPYCGDKKRSFEFQQAFAENLPFENQSFDGALFATSLDHCLKPCQATRGAHRILKSKGHLFLWATIRDDDNLYKDWYKAPKPQQYDKYHMWVFTERSMRHVLRDFTPLKLYMLSKYTNGYEALIVCQK